MTHETFSYRVEQALRARANAELRGLVADLLPRPRWLGVATAAAYRRVLRSADRWLRGRPPTLAMPTGSQRRFTIGRERACDMTLTDQTVSRWHASLERGPDGWLLADLGSTNGTRVNGWRVTSPSRVRAGDLVTFGSTTFVVADRPQ
jgi:Inner membrane component of T3SS, cytoplasmic domain